jgi:shikimate kinase
MKNSSVRIFLVGYMCSGKTTLGKYLAKEMNLHFIDLDEYIEEKESQTIAQIFEVNGEYIFRELEHNYLKELSLLDDVIIATGGGAPCFSNNMKLINDTGISVYLKTSISVLIDRLLVMGDNRPLVRGQSREELNKFVIPHFKDRESFYEEAKIKIICDDWDEKKLSSQLVHVFSDK